MLERVPLGVAAWAVLVVAPTGTLVVISVLDTFAKAAAVPLKVTAVAYFFSSMQPFSSPHYGVTVCITDTWLLQ